MCELRRQTGTQFDPQVVDLLCAHLETVPASEDASGEVVRLRSTS